MANSLVLQFKITLQDITPPVWRRIQVSNEYTFWDLHVAIQDAMGWTDSHLHLFKVTNPATGKKEHIGIPDGEDDAYPTLAGWDLKVAHYLSVKANQKIAYLYDFGDSWDHLIEFEGEHAKQAAKYPVCLAGERACPPEDVSGVPGYEHFLSVIKNPKHKEHKEFLEWVGGKYDPEKFEPKKVKFDNPKVKWCHAFREAVEC